MNNDTRDEWEEEDEDEENDKEEKGKGGNERRILIKNQSILVKQHKREKSIIWKDDFHWFHAITPLTMRASLKTAEEKERKSSRSCPLLN